MLYVYFTQGLKDQLKGKFKDVRQAIEVLKNRVEQSQTTGNFERFADGYIVKKFVRNKYRLIARKEIIVPEAPGVEKQELLVFYYLLNRKDPIYTDASSGFCKNPAGFAELHHFESPTFKQDCLDYYKTRSQENNVVKSKAELSDYENTILYETMRGCKTEGKSFEIYEMKEWVRSLKDDENKDISDTFISDLYKNVVDAVTNAVCEPVDPGFRIQAVEYGSNHKKYFGYYFNQSEYVIFLGVIKKTAADVQKFIDDNTEFFKNFNKERAVKRALRSYSDAVVANENDHSQWAKIESNASNNMALSSEELGVLDSVQNSDKRKYPLFINGRAGSGKSTILQFNFASYFFHYLRSENENDACPVYFTYNDKLLTTARETVDSLLENHDYIGSADYQESERERMRAKKTRSRENVYRNFSAFLLEVARQDKTFNFLPQNHMTFQKFKEKWYSQFKSNREVRKLNPEICWHVIRTYIKGNSVDAPVDVQSFENEMDSAISMETFKLIYNEVWTPWYSTLALYSSIEDGEEDGAYFNRNFQAKYWDDQDLVHYVLEVDEGNAESESLLDRYFKKHSRYSAVFCDESQDFTQIELEAILNTSLFLHRKVPDREVCRIPFVFAGDPFQTLNPTGFSWNTVKDSFVGIIAKSLDVKADDVKMNYKELKSNYRSEKEIVKVSNGIQMVRAAKLNPDRSVIEPQLPWSEEKGLALFYDWSSAPFWKWLESNQTVSFILPCESDSKYQYVENDKYLREHICRMDHEVGDQKRYKYPIFSAQDVKGLEYDTVVVYGFGSFKDDDIGSRFKNLVENENATEKSSLELEYFINRLYVAVTRPKKQLYILDDKDTFWSILSKKNNEDDSAVKKLAELVPQNCREAWLKEDGSIEKKLSVPTMGRSSDLKGEATAADKEKFAEQLYQEGVDNRDVERLSYAYQSYTTIFGADSAKSLEIQACIHYLKGEYRDAAKAFVDSGNNVPAHHCWFLDLPVPVSSGPAIDNMRKLQREDGDCEESNERRLAECAYESISVDGFCTALKECCKNYHDYAEHCSHSIFTWDIDFEKWQGLFNDVLKKLSGSPLNESDLTRVNDAIEEQDLIEFDKLSLAGFYFVNKKYEKVVDLDHENCSSELSRLVEQAKIYKAGFPKNLPALMADKNYELICKIWAEQGESVVDKLEVADIKNICLAHRELKKNVDEQLLVRMFNKFIDSKAWTDYYKNLKQKTYRHETVQVLNSIVTGRQDKRVGQKIYDAFKKNASLKTVEEFNAIYTYCVGVVNEHPTELDLKVCYNLLKSHFINMQPVIERFDMSLGEVSQIGRFVEYVSGQVQENDRDRYWGYALDFYRKILELDWFKKPEQQLYLQKRMIFCAEARAAAYEKVLKKPGRKQMSMVDTMIFNLADLKREGEHLRSEYNITEKIESVTSGKADETMRIAAQAWRNDGYLVKHVAAEIVPEIVAEAVAESVEEPAVEPVAEIVAESVAEINAESVVEAVAESVVDFVENSAEGAAVESATETAVIESSAETTEEPVAEPVVNTAVASVPEENVAETVLETAVEPVTEPVVMAAAELVAEPAAAPIEETVAETVAAKPSFTSDATSPQELNLECCGYIFRKSNDDEFAIDVYAKQDKEIYLGTCNSYGFSPKHQKNFASKNPPHYKYGDLPSFTIDETDDYYNIQVGIVSLFVKKIDG